MTSNRGGGGGGGVLAAALVLLLAGIGVVGWTLLSAPAPPPRPSATALPQPARAQLRSPGPSLPPATPLRVDIDRIDVHAPIAAAGTDPDGQLEVPPLSEPYLTNWYAAGPAPGQLGNAVIVGHVDTRRVGAAVFYYLGNLRAGDVISVTRDDEITAVFRVQAVGAVPKDRFPAETVYGPADDAQLRLITCGGDFDRSTRNYDSNVIVTATLSGWHHQDEAKAAPLRTYIPDLPSPTPSKTKKKR